MRVRMNPRTRKDLIFKAALRIALRPGGWIKLTRTSIAKEAGCSAGLVSSYLGTMATIRRLLILHAIEQGLTEIINQGIAAADLFTLKRLKK